MNQVVTIGLDIAKSAFQVHRVEIRRLLALAGTASLLESPVAAVAQDYAPGEPCHVDRA